MCLAAARSAHIIDQVSAITPLRAGDGGCISDIPVFHAYPSRSAGARAWRRAAPAHAASKTTNSNISRSIGPRT